MATILPLTIPTIYPFWSQDTKSHQFPFYSCWNVHNLPSPILITLLVVILNSINSFFPLDTALVLTSDHFLSIFPPLLPSSCSFPCWVLLENVMWHHLYFVSTYIYSLLIGQDLCENQNVSIKFLWTLLVYLCLTSRDLFIFFIPVLSVLSFPKWSLI